MKRFLLSTYLLLSFFGAFSQQVYFKCDFSDGIPETMSLYDIDGNEPSVDMKNLGFEVGIPWVIADPDNDGNLAACSTSWYKTAGKSNDWMVSPAMTVTSEKAVVRWKAKAGDNDYRDGYMVLISENGSDPENFNVDEPVFSVSAEKSQWESHEVSLAPYVGKEINIAFVNNSKDKATLYIDDIIVGIPSSLEIKSALSRVVTQTGKITVSADITNTTSEKIERFTVKYSFDGGDIVSEEMDKSIGAGRTVRINFSSPISIEKNQTLPYTLWVEK